MARRSQVEANEVERLWPTQPCSLSLGNFLLSEFERIRSASRPNSALPSVPTSAYSVSTWLAQQSQAQPLARALRQP